MKTMIDIETLVKNISHKREQKERETLSKQASLRESLFIVCFRMSCVMDILAILVIFILSIIRTCMSGGNIFYLGVGLTAFLCSVFDIGLLCDIYDSKDENASIKDFKYLICSDLMSLVIKVIPFCILVFHGK